MVDVARCESNTISTSAHAAADQLIRLKRSSTTLNLIIIIIVSMMLYFNYITLAEPKLPVADDSLVVVSIAPKSQTKWAKWASATGGRTICGSIWFAWALGGQVARWPGGGGGQHLQGVDSLQTTFESKTGKSGTWAVNTLNTH